jgi:ATP-dependent Clp protease ATP-binding subunit ClpC
VRRARAGLAAVDEPLAVFLFLGPSGVGKTELAKTLAARVMGSEKALVRIDGSEYAQSHSASRLVSAPPGYIGHGKGGQLTEPVRRRPYSVVLIDEVEKMHPDVWNYLLQVMDDGRLTDGEGRTADFRHAIIILTSNIGAGKAGRGVGFAAGDGVEQKSERLIAAAKREFPPEFYNRIDDAIVFEPLTIDDAKEITVKLCLELTAKLLAERNLQLQLSDELVAALAADGFDEEYGARPLRRHLRKTIEKALVDAIIARELDHNQAVYAELDLARESTVKLTITPLPELESAAAGAFVGVDAVAKD